MEKFNVNLLFNQLKQDVKSDIQILKLIDGTMSLLIAELKAGKKLSTHYHNEGTEIYQILAGEGNIELGELSGDTVIWNDNLTIKPGDIFEVKPKTVHRLSNNSTESLRIIFFAPPSHLDDDRVFL